jgi:TolB-like protein/class 3 adenylate cyclase
VGETRKIAAILVSDVVGYSRLAGADEDRTLARLRGLRSDLIDPTIAVHKGRVVKRTGDGAIVEFRSVVGAVNCAIEVQRAMVERNAGVAPDKRIEFRIGIHLGDVVEEADGDLMGDGVNIAARLEGVAKPGGICISDDAYRQVKGRLELKVNDLGLTQLKNIAEPIRVYALDVGHPAQPKPSSPAPTAPPEKSSPPRLSIVVLPFANIGGDPDQEHFVDGVTESLTTDLSRIRGARVVARNTAFTFKGKPLDVKTVGRELNVRYVLEGSVQRGGNRMRVNVQLIDAESGNHLWAERFDKPLVDLFDMQDEIVARLAGALNAQLVAAEARRAEQVPNPDSMDLFFQGLAWLNKGITPDNVARARSFFDRALTADPDNVAALIGSAGADVVAGSNWFVADGMAAFAAAGTKLSKALSSVPDHAIGHMSLGFVDIMTKRAAEGIAECEHALALDRNLAGAYHFIGIGKIFIGRAEETEAQIVEARVSHIDSRRSVGMIEPVVFVCRAGGFERSRHLNSGRAQIYRIFRWKRNGREVAYAYEARPGLFKFGGLLRRDLITLVAPTVKLPPTFLSCAVHCRYLRPVSVRSRVLWFGVWRGACRLVRRRSRARARL